MTLPDFSDVRFQKRLHFWLAVVWFIAAFPIMIFFANSISLLVFISVYAIVNGEIAAWQAASGEVDLIEKIDEG